MIQRFFDWCALIVAHAVLGKAAKPEPVAAQDVVTYKVEHHLSDVGLILLQAKLPKPVVTATTTDLQAGFQLGIQHVLNTLRESRPS